MTEMAPLVSPHPTVVHAVRARTHSTPDAPAVTDGRAACTWGDYGRRMRHLTCGLVGAGVEPGDRCAVVAEGVLGWLTHLAVMSAGAITVLAGPDPDPPTVERTASRLLGDDEETLLKIEQVGAEIDAEEPDLYESLALGVRPEHVAAMTPVFARDSGAPVDLVIDHRVLVWTASSLGLALSLGSSDPHRRTMVEAVGRGRVAALVAGPVLHAVSGAEAVTVGEADLPAAVAAARPHVAFARGPSWSEFAELGPGGWTGRAIVLEPDEATLVALEAAGVEGLSAHGSGRTCGFMALGTLADGVEPLPGVALAPAGSRVHVRGGNVCAWHLEGDTPVGPDLVDGWLPDEELWGAASPDQQRR